MSIFHIQNLTVTFENDRKKFDVLKDLSLNFERHELVAITGKSGCGKSTLLNVLFGIEKPTIGTVAFCGKDINKMNNKEFSFYHSNRVSIVFQHYNLLDNLTSLENVILPLLIRGVKKRKAIKKAITIFNYFKLTKLIDKNVSLLSGGERQRIAIIRAIITEPEVILCDEPTGALDTTNSLQLMDILREISRKTLVILVSHNNQLVEKYADRIIELKDGKVSFDTSGNELKNAVNYPFKVEINGTNNSSKIIVKKHLKENKKRNCLTLGSISFGLTVIFLTFGFANGSKNTGRFVVKNLYSNGYASASVTEEYDIENSPLKYTKNKCPTDEELNNYFSDFSHVTFETNYSYVFPSNQMVRYEDNNYDNVSFIPCLELDLTSDLLINSIDVTNCFNEVFVNVEFCKTIGLNQQTAIDKMFSTSYECSFSVETGDTDEPFIKETINLYQSFKIVGVLKEFTFLGCPRVYYCNNYLNDELNDIELKKISDYKGKRETVASFINASSSDSAYKSYSKNVFLKDKNELNNFLDLISKNNELNIESNCILIRDNFVNFMDSFSNALLVFSVISFVGVSLVVGMLAFSSFMERKKEAAILSCLGSKTSNIKQIFLNENYVLLIIGFLVSIFTSIAAQFIINFFLNKYLNISTLISIPFLSFFSTPFLLPLIIFFLASILITISITFPITIYSKKSLTNELRDE